MTVAALNVSSGPFLGNGATTVFPFTFSASSAAEIQVLVNSAVVASGFTISLNADQSTSPGGSATFSTAPATGTTILIVANPSFQQNISFKDSGPFLQSTLDTALDRIARLLLYLRDKLGRAVVFPPGETVAALPSMAARAGKFLGFDSSGNFVALPGTGGDADLRSALAAATGYSLVGGLPPFIVPQTTGNGTANDSPALQAALDLGGIIILPPPPVRYNFASPVTVAVDGTHILGVGWPEIYVNTASSQLFTVRANRFTFEGAKFTGAPTLAAAVFKIDTAFAALNQIRVRDVFGTNLFHFYEDNGGNALFGSYLDEIKLEQHRGYGVNTTKHFGYFYIEKIGVSRVGLSGTDYNFPAVKVQNAEGVFLDSCAHDGTNTTSIQSGQHGFHFVSCNFVSIENSIPDHVGGNGILADTCGTIEIDGCDIPNVNLSAVKGINCTGVRIDGGVYNSFATGSSSACGVELTGCTSIEIPSAHATQMKADGFKFTSCGDVNLGLTIARSNGGAGYNLVTSTDVSCASIQAIANTGAGFISAGCNTVITTGMISRNNTGRGISSGTSDVAVQHIGPRMSANTAGNYIISDASNRISLGVLSDNTLVNVTAPGAA